PRIEIAPAGEPDGHVRQRAAGLADHIRVVVARLQHGDAPRTTPARERPHRPERVRLQESGDRKLGNRARVRLDSGQPAAALVKAGDVDVELLWIEPA